MQLVPSSLDLDSIMVGNGDNGAFDGTEDHTHITYQTYLLARTTFTNDTEGFASMFGAWDVDSGEYVGVEIRLVSTFGRGVVCPPEHFLDGLYNAEILTNENHPVYNYIFNQAKYSIGETIFFKTDIEDLASTGGSGVVEEVQFFVNGRLEDSLTTAPYEFAWTSEEAGKYEAYVVVFDNEGNQAVSAVKEIIIDEAEEGTITLLYPNENVDHSFAPSGKIPVIADVDYEGLVSRVDVFVGGNQMGSMVQFDGGDNANLYSNRFTSVIEDLTARCNYTLQLDAFGENNQRVFHEQLPILLFLNFKVHSHLR